MKTVWTSRWLLAATTIAFFLLSQRVTAADFTASQNDKLVTVVCNKNIAYKAIVDHAHGGTISAFYLKADGLGFGPNLVADNAALRYRGLMSAFYIGGAEGSD